MVGGHDVVDQLVQRRLRPVLRIGDWRLRRLFNRHGHFGERYTLLLAGDAEWLLAPATEIDAIALEDTYARRLDSGNFGDGGALGNGHGFAPGAVILGRRPGMVEQPAWCHDHRMPRNGRRVFARDQRAARFSFTSCKSGEGIPCGHRTGATGTSG